MNGTMVAHPTRNGHAPHAGRCPVPLLAAKVDQLDRLRTRLADLAAAERQLTDELLAAMAAQSLTRLAGVAAVAMVEPETSMVPLAALTPAERRRIGEADVPRDDLEAFAVAIPRPELRLAPVRPAVLS